MFKLLSMDIDTKHSGGIEVWTNRNGMVCRDYGRGIYHNITNSSRIRLNELIFRARCGENKTRLSAWVGSNRTTITIHRTD